MKFWGEFGSQGEAGPPGPQGPAGPAGADGVDGADGAQGPQGIQGPAGPQGLVGAAGADGADGVDGAQGADGWSPVFALVDDGERRVFELVDWVGGTGSPPVDYGYVGYSGLVVDVGDGVDVRGDTGAAGADGTDGLDADPQYYNVDDYGADPTGAVDSSVAIGNAASAATNSGARIGHVIMGTNPGSIYKITSVPLIYSNLILEGFGATLVNTQAVGAYAGFVGTQVGNSSTNFNENITIRNVTIKGAPLGKIWTLAQMRNCVFENVKFDPNGQAGQFTLINTNIGVTFRRCTLDTLDDYVARFSGSTSEIVFDNCIINANSKTVLFGSGSSVKNIEFRNCLFKEVGVYVAELFSCKGVSFRRCRVVNSGANIGFGEIASLNSACTDIDMRGITPENAAATFVNASMISNGAQFQGPNTYNAVGTGATLSSGGQIRVGRLLADQGTALAAADVAVSAGWGATATKSIAGTDMNGVVTVGAAGAGQAANPTVTVTFKDGAWPQAPRVFVQNLTGGAARHHAPVTSVSTTTFTFTPEFTPVAGTTYTYSYIVQGKK